MTPTRRVPTTSLGGDTISRLIVGGWQLSSGHRNESIDEGRLFDALTSMARAGMTTFDCADIYIGVEELFGRFHARHADELRRDGIELAFHTKFVPDRDALATLTKRDVERIIDRSLKRLGVEQLDLVQFSWWDYDTAGYVEAALHLTELKQAGKIRKLGATNFDVTRMIEMLDAGVPFVSNQVQYSLLDRRPEHGMAHLAGERGLGLLCYGALAGGFLSNRYLDQPPPEPPHSNRSLTKYRLIIEEIGGWEVYQGLLRVLAEVARRHGGGIPSVALRYALDRPHVLGAMIGTFDGAHYENNLNVFGWDWTNRDRAQLDLALRDVRPLAGDVFDLERDPTGPHARIMRTNLNRER